MTSQEKLQAVREAVIKAVPSIQGRNTSMILDGVFSGIVNHRDDKIRLADALAAMNNIKCGKFDVDLFYHAIDGSFEKSFPIFWNLLDDDLNHQTPETISFLYEILCTKKVG